MQASLPSADSATQTILQQNPLGMSDLDRKSLELYVPNRYLTSQSSDGKSESKHDDDAQERVAQFVNDPEQYVLLVTGGSGSGKSLLLWHEYRLFRDKFKKRGEDWLPIHISLPTIHTEKLRSDLLLETALSKLGLKADEIQEVRKMKRVLFFLDGFDETGLLENLLRRRPRSAQSGDCLPKPVLGCHSELLCLFQLQCQASGPSFQ